VSACSRRVGCDLTAQQYAFDATTRVFEAQQNAIEQEVIRARETGYNEGYNDGYAISTRANAELNERLERQAQTIADLQERNDWQAARLEENADYSLRQQEALTEARTEIERIKEGIREFIRTEYPVFAAMNGLL
jgi:flagellar biosynthesis/type III secretory pathway protein FliH